jgi:hypothetical protein
MTTSQLTIDRQLLFQRAMKNKGEALLHANRAKGPSSVYQLQLLSTP